MSKKIKLHPEKSVQPTWATNSLTLFRKKKKNTKTSYLNSHEAAFSLLVSLPSAQTRGCLCAHMGWRRKELVGDSLRVNPSDGDKGTNGGQGT